MCLTSIENLRGQDSVRVLQELYVLEEPCTGGTVQKGYSWGLLTALSIGGTICWKNYALEELFGGVSALEELCFGGTMCWRKCSVEPTWCWRNWMLHAPCARGTIEDGLIEIERTVHWRNCVFWRSQLLEELCVWGTVCWRNHALKDECLSWTKLTYGM